MRKALQSNMDAVKQYTASVAQRDVHRLSGDVEKLTCTFQKWAGDIKNEIGAYAFICILSDVAEIHVLEQQESYTATCPAI